MAACDVFVSYAHADRVRVLELRDALVARGVRVWLDEDAIETFASISNAIEHGLARSKALVAFCSAAYPGRRACQWELTAAFIAAQRADTDPRERVLVVNPEDGVGHIEPVQLRDALFATATAPATGDGVALDALAQQIAGHVAGLDGALGELGVAARPAWVGRRAVGAARFVGRTRDMWQIHSALTAGSVGLIAGAHMGDPAVKVTGMGGIGKSLLAQEYALRFAAGYPGGVFWLRAHGHDDRGDTLTEDDVRASSGESRELGPRGPVRPCPSARPAYVPRAAFCLHCRHILFISEGARCAPKGARRTPRFAQRRSGEGDPRVLRSRVRAW